MTVVPLAHAIHLPLPEVVNCNGLLVVSLTSNAVLEITGSAAQQHCLELTVELTVETFRKHLETHLFETTFITA